MVRSDLRSAMCVLFLLCLLSYAPFAHARCEDWAAQAVSVQGSVEALRAEIGKWEKVQLNDTFCPGDQIHTLSDGRVNLRLASSAVMRLSKNSSITLSPPKQKGSSMVDMIKGAAHLFSRKPESLEVKTPYAIAGVRGTEFVVEVSDQTFLSIFEGSVLAQNDAGSLRLTSGQSAVAQPGQAPALRAVARPRDAVTWALYYPPLVPSSSASGAQAMVAEAQQMLSVGRISEANEKLSDALKTDPQLAEAYALQSIVAVVQNDKETALSLANQAVAANPNSAASHLASSYAKQARFDLEGARRSAEEAVRVDNGNSLAWARLAEIQAMFGDLDASLSSARKSSELSPGNARAQTVLGFSNLQLQKIPQAVAAFNKAIELDQADPMPRLGLGLAMVRQGKLEDGGKQIEVAASLDPGNSLIRSYLAKVYYEEKRSNLEERETGIAKELDPNDPTPWFYEAISLDSKNRPIEALHAYQKSIELNDNRSVYRSSLMLDSDEAARSAGIARVYGELGFQQRALAEGWNAVATDPTDYSAHRFLADSYSVLPRHEIARVSELLQSQLLQPLTLTPLQPSLAESSQMLTSSLGVGGASYNEFTPLIAGRNRGAYLLNGLLGENHTKVGEGVISAIGDNIAISAGFSHSATDGWRENAYQNGNLVNLFSQWQASADTSLQVEFRHKTLDEGDIDQNFFTDVYWPTLRNELTSYLYRVGLRHTFAPGSVLLGSYLHQDMDTEMSLSQSFEGGSVEAYFPEEVSSDGLELQYRHHSEHVDLVAGYGYADIDHKLQTSVVTEFMTEDGPVVDEFTSEEDLDVIQSTMHAYFTFKPSGSVALTLGASNDVTSGDDPITDNRRQVNPKAGMIWNPLDGTTIRAAWFKVMERALITGQTLEPTQVAGFNQFFYDSNGANSTRYGLAVDQKFSDSIFAGIELSRRELEMFSLDPMTGGVVTDDYKEGLGRCYAYWTPTSMISLAVEYQVEHLESEDAEVAEGYDPDTDTTFTIPLGRFKYTSQRLPLSANFFHPSGFSASIKGTYYRQEGAFQDAAGFYSDGEESFFLWDAALRYRFPEQRGSFMVGAKNLFDKEFRYFDIDEETRSIQPDRMVYGMLSLTF